MLEVALFAFLSSLALTPLLGRLARATGYVDHPAARKAHTRSTPLLGGVAIAGALVIAPLVAGTFAAPPAGITVGALVALVLGLIDDRRPLGPRGKLFGQLLAGGCLVYWGTEVAELRGNPILGALAVIAVMALLNAVNFLDNMDGILGALVPVTACGFVGLAWIHGAPAHLSLAFGLIGACLGFLVHNAPPARIFLGDAGSHLLGFALAALALEALEGSFTLPHVAAILLILAYPIFDATFVVCDRVSGGRAFYVGSTDHTTHRLGKRFGKRGTIAIVSLAAAWNTVLGVWAWGRSDALSIVCVLCVSVLGYALFATFLRHISPTT